MHLAVKHDLAVIEDCAQAHGAKWRGTPVGGLGDAAAWSFCQDKIMTTGGEGGMLTTNSQDVWSAAWSYKDHGKSFEAVYHRQHAPGFRWLHESFGTNWRMLEVQGVLGRIQLTRMNDWHKARTANATPFWPPVPNRPRCACPLCRPRWSMPGTVPMCLYAPRRWPKAGAATAS
jgi:dTDP-4-amino-4,6-dideoxygalactose transaminase